MKSEQAPSANTPKAASRNRSRTYTIALIGVMTAVACILGPVSVPVPGSPVPISLTHLSVFLALYVLGMKRGALSYVIYLLLGAVGLPVFSGYQGGLGKLFGPTGGYLIGFLFMALAAGWFIDHTEKRALHLIGMVLGDALCYLFGTLWIMQQMHLGLGAAMTACVIPYLPGDLLKMAACLLIGPVLRRQLRRAGLSIL